MADDEFDFDSEFPELSEQGAGKPAAPPTAKPDAGIPSASEKAAPAASAAAASEDDDEFAFEEAAASLTASSAAAAAAASNSAAAAAEPVEPLKPTPAAASVVPISSPCELCDTYDAVIRCEECSKDGFGLRFCDECSEVLHAKNPGHLFTDMAGNPLAGSEAEAAENSSAAAQSVTAETTAAADRPKSATKSNAGEAADSSDLPPRTDGGTRRSSGGATDVASHFAEQAKERAADPSRISGSSPFRKSSNAEDADADSDAQKAVAAHKRRSSGGLQIASAVAPSTEPPISAALCHSCEQHTVQLYCENCKREYCNTCDGEVHATRELRKHVRKPLEEKLLAAEVSSASASESESESNQVPPSASPVFGSPASENLYDPSPLASPSLDASSNAQGRRSSGSATLVQIAEYPLKAPALEEKKQEVLVLEPDEKNQQSDKAAASSAATTAAAKTDDAVVKPAQADVAASPVESEEEPAPFPAAASAASSPAPASSPSAGDSYDDEDEFGFDSADGGGGGSGEDVAALLSEKAAEPSAKQNEDKEAAQKATTPKSLSKTEPEPVIKPSSASKSLSNVVTRSNDESEDEADSYGDDFDASTPAAKTATPAAAAPSEPAKSVAADVSPKPITPAPRQSSIAPTAERKPSRSQSRSKPTGGRGRPSSGKSDASESANYQEDDEFGFEEEEVESESPIPPKPAAAPTGDKPILPAISSNAPPLLPKQPSAGVKFAPAPKPAAAKPTVSPSESKPTQAAKPPVEKKAAAKPLAPQSSKKVSNSSSSSTAATATSPAKKAPKRKEEDDEYGDEAEFDAGEGETAESSASENTTILESFFNVLLQDPLAEGAMPLLEGIVLPPTVIFRSGKPSAVYYTDAHGFVLYHAWQTSREKKEEAKARERAKSLRSRDSSPEKGESHSPSRRAVTSSQAAQMLHVFHPLTAAPTSAVLSPTGVPLPPAVANAAVTYHPKSAEQAAVDILTVLRWFTPQLRERNTNFLRKQQHKQLAEKHKKEQQEQAIKEEKDASSSPAASTSAQKGAKSKAKKSADEEDGYSSEEHYSDDEETRANDAGAAAATDRTTASTASTGSSAALAQRVEKAAAAARALEEQFAAAQARSLARRGQVNIEAWKKEERLLMRARQRYIHAQEALEKAKEKEEQRQTAIAQEKLFVALLVFTGGAAPLPTPYALTLGQVRQLFGKVVLSAADSIPADWTVPSTHDFVVQKLEFAPGPDHHTFRVEFDESRSGTSVAVSLCHNAWRGAAEDKGKPVVAPPSVAASAREEKTADKVSTVAAMISAPVLPSRSSEGFKHAEQCYTYKGPDEAGTYTKEVQLRYNDTHRRFKKIMFSLMRRVAECAKQGRPTFLQCYFQQGVPAPQTDAQQALDNVPELAPAGGSSAPLDPRRRPWYFLFADGLELCRKVGAGGTNAKSPERPVHVLKAPPTVGSGGMLDVAAQQAALSAPGAAAEAPPLLYQQNEATGETILPGIHSYTPMVLHGQGALDRSKCCKCHARLLPGEGQLVMLRQILLKWVPNKHYEYPEELFSDILGVDDSPQRANWHRVTVVACGDCMAEIRALKTIPPRTQLAPWLGSIAAQSVPTPALDDPQVQAGTKVSSASVVVPVPMSTTKHAAEGPATLPSLLPYLSRAPVLHSSGHGHSSELVPGVAFVKTKNVSMMELQGVVSLQGGLALRPQAELRANMGGLARTNLHPIAAGRSAILAVAHSPDLSGGLFRSRVDEAGLPKAAPLLSSKGTFVLQSAYLSETNLNPHAHPTHGAPPALAALQSPPKKKILVASASAVTLPAHRKALTPFENKMVVRLGLAHSASTGSLASTSSAAAPESVVAAKSSVAGGAGTTPSVPHRPLAPTVILSPVKAGAPLVSKVLAPNPNSQQAWALKRQEAEGGGQTKFPSLGSPPQQRTASTLTPQRKPKPASTHSAPHATANGTSSSGTKLPAARSPNKAPPSGSTNAKGKQGKAKAGSKQPGQKAPLTNGVVTAASADHSAQNGHSQQPAAAAAAEYDWSQQGYWNEQGEWVAYDQNQAQGWYDEQGQWHSYDEYYAQQATAQQQNHSDQTAPIAPQSDALRQTSSTIDDLYSPDDEFAEPDAVPATASKRHINNDPGDGGYWQSEIPDDAVVAEPSSPSKAAISTTQPAAAKAQPATSSPVDDDEVEYSQSYADDSFDA